MSEEQHRTGDTVWLKSGGPSMTVTAVFPGKIVVEWEANGRKQTSAYHPDALVHDRPKRKG